MLLLAIHFLNVSFVIADEQGNNSQVIILSQYNPPFVSTNEQGELIGTVVLKLQGILDQAGIDYKMQSVSWKRSLADVQQYPEVLSFPVSRIPEREKLYKWIIPLHRITSQLYGLRAKFDAELSDIKNGEYTFICSEKTVSCSALRSFGIPEQSITILAQYNNNQY